MVVKGGIFLPNNLLGEQMQCGMQKVKLVAITDCRSMIMEIVFKTVLREGKNSRSPSRNIWETWGNGEGDSFENESCSPTRETKTG